MDVAVYNLNTIIEYVISDNYSSLKSYKPFLTPFPTIYKVQ